MLGYGAATGEMHICIRDETWKYHEIFFRKHLFRTSTSRYVRSNVSSIRICHVYGGNKWIIYTLAASPTFLKTHNVAILQFV